MDDTSKYLIHARIVASGVVERSDVVGAVFGQTEGLLGDELDLRDLQQSSKVGRIDVQIDSENGQSFGELTIATSLDKVETAILGAALETITRVGPCRAQVEVTDIEDVRAAKRREVVGRAKELLAEGFDESVMSSEELLAEVRESARVADIAEYGGMPAGPRVVDSDAIIVVEGRADVLQLLKYGIKNAVAVEGTNIPESIAALTNERTVTTFLDGDRGGELILKELAQVGDVDYVAFAPSGSSVEDLGRAAVLSALREKMPFELLVDEPNIRETVTSQTGATDAETQRSAMSSVTSTKTASETNTQTQASDTEVAVNVVPSTGTEAARSELTDNSGGKDTETASESSIGDTDARDTETIGVPKPPQSIREYVTEVIAGATDTAVFLDGSCQQLDTCDTGKVFATLESTETVPETIVLDGTLDQRLLDLATDRGVEQIVATAHGEFVKKPVGTRTLTGSQLLDTVTH